MISVNMISPARANVEEYGYICACDADTPGTLQVRYNENAKHERFTRKAPGCGKHHLDQFPSLAAGRECIAENVEMQKL